MESTNTIQAIGLRKKYNDTLAVDKLDLSIRQGELFSLIGLNGAGKTTTIKMLCTLTAPSEGDALINGKSILNEADEVKRIIAVSPQQTAIAPNLSAYENLELICGIYGFARNIRESKIKDISSKLNLDSILNRRAGKLSGGWQRRLSIAMALISDPKILFLDEPTLGLDVIARSELWDIIRNLKGKVTIILTTHYMEEAESLSDRIGVMKNGRLLFVGKCSELIERTECSKFEDAFVTLLKEENI